MADDWDDQPTSTTELGAVASQVSVQPTLTVLTGGGTGKLFKLKGKSLIGRAPSCEVRVDDDGISRNHASVTIDGGAAHIEDLGSRNGTFVNGDKLTAPVQLRDGDKIQLGRATVLRFAFQDALDDSFHENMMSSALRDGLTKLFNKRYLMERLDSELKFAQRHDTALSLLMIDVDHFKRVNDTHGHLAGDAVLAQLAWVLSRAVRNEDVIARFGGEEIAIVLRAIDLENATRTAERLRRLVEQTVVPFHDKKLGATVSIGVAGYPATPAKTMQDLLEAADRALYQAKRDGRNRVAR